MTKHCFPHLSSPKSALRLCIVIVGLGAFFPAITDAARPGGGTCTTMVLSYAYSPPKWVVRCDPPAGPGADLKVTAYKFSLSYDSNRMGFDTVTPKFPFSATATNSGVAVNVMGSTGNLANTSFKDVDIFELAFGPTLLNALAAVFTENFDGVVAPALPPGWTSTNSGAGTPWFTSMMAPNSSPNDASAVVQSNIGEGQLLSPQFSVPASGARLTFKNRYNTEAAHDGMVLEISINGGAFADVITAGGTFVSGGYNEPIVGATGSPIAGRSAWSGDSLGWINTAVNLPVSANGQPVQLRWRLATDDSPGAGVGAQLDDISIDPPQPSFTVFANPMANDYLRAVDPLNPGTTIQFDAAQIAPTTRVFTVGVLPHMWDPDGVYDNGTIGGAGVWDITSNQWDDLPYPQPPSFSSSDTHWDNTTHANDFAVFGGDPGSGPGSGIVTVNGSISVGGFQFDISGYTIQGGNLLFPMSVPTTTTIETNANTATISSPISGGGFTKVGSGTLILTGANSYTGTTTINAGTLLIDNSASSGTGTSAVMVNNSGCVLGGTGTISGPVNVNSGAAVLGGDGTTASGTLTMTNDLNLNHPGSIIKLALGSGVTHPHSTLNRGGGSWAFDVGGGQHVTFVNFGVQNGTYQGIITGLANDPGVNSWVITNPGITGMFTYIIDGPGTVGHINLTITGVPPPFTLLTVVSRKNHDAAGEFDIPLPLNNPGVECRSGGASGSHKLVFTFSSPVSLDNATVTMGTGSVSFFYSSGTTITVYLTGVSNAQLITVGLSNVTDGASQANFAVSAGILAGDVSGNGNVSATDVSLVKTQAGAIVTNSNFRRDVVVNGSINSSDISLVKLASGTALPPKPAR